MTIHSLEPPTDPRSASIRVAGPAALLMAKCHKIADRLEDSDKGRTHRVKPKDCGDVIRIMRSPTGPAAVGQRLAELAHDPRCTNSIISGVQYLQQQFGTPNAPGIRLAATALAGALPEDLLRALAPSYVSSVLAAYSA